MKYICLGYIEPGKIDGMSEDERHAMFDECFEYNDHLRANGHLVAEVPLQAPETALTLHWKNGKVSRKTILKSTELKSAAPPIPDFKFPNVKSHTARIKVERAARRPQ